MSSKFKWVAGICLIVWSFAATARAAQDSAASRGDPAARVARGNAAAAPAPGEHIRLDPNDAPRLRWMSLDGCPPGTYAQYLQQHPLSPARFAHARTITPRPDAPAPRGGESGIAVLVDADLYPLIQTGLNQYITDLTLDGYTVFVEAVSGGTPEEIKAWIRERYEAGAEGILFVGGITAAWAQWEDAFFPCDLFYMDLDGYWGDAGQDGVYETHTAGNGDEGPEVYVARMYTPTLSWDAEANMVNGYFNKAHDYRYGALTQPWRGLEYIDEPWYGYSYFLNFMYGENVVRHDFGHLTTAADYLEQLDLGQHYVQVCAHSGAEAHFFGTHPTESAAYAHVYVYSPATRPARLLLGSDDGIKVWLNGDVVLNEDFYWHWWEPGWVADQFGAEVNLLEGWNRLLCKISQRDSDFEFSTRFTDMNYLPFGDLGYQTDDPDTHGSDPHTEPGCHIGTWLLNGLYENSDENTRLSQDYLGAEADVRPSQGDPAPYGSWERVTRDGCPFDVAVYYRDRYGPGGHVTSANIQERDPPVFFYNLFACGSGRFTEDNYLGGSCIFNTTCGLITIASAKSGSMVNFEYFNAPLGEGQTFGQAYFEWWNAQAPYPHGLRGWIYGMVLSGDPTLRLIHTTQDCNNNGIPDVYDIADGTSEDCNGNWMPDECEPDCNGNGVADECDITDGTSADCNNNGIPDECIDLENDCNGNNVPDECDVADGTSQDCNGNLIPDECEPDCNGNGIPDECDIADGTSQDCNLNGIPDECDIADGSSTDDNDNGVPDECELPVRYVDANAPPGGSGLSWSTAFNNLQEALDSAAASEGYVNEIWVATGTYTPAEPGGDRTATFQLISGVALCGGFAGGETSPDQRDPEANVTVLSGDLNGDDGPDFTPNGENSYHVVTGSGCDENTILDGFTITGGNADVSAYPYGWGAGVYTQAGSPTLIACTLTRNTARYLGGGMFNDDGSPTLINCVFAGNSAGNDGGAMLNYRSDPILTNCTFSGNSSGGDGGAIYNSNSSSTLINCVFAANLAGEYGGGLYGYNGSSTLSNCILWGNSDSGGTDESAQICEGTPSINYCCVQGWTGSLGGVGNIGDDPLFVDGDGPDGVFGTEDDDLRVSPGSPCIDAGDNDAVPADYFDLDNDGDTDERLPYDLDGHARFVDDPDTPDSGQGLPPIVDMGAYEFLGCLGDLDGDGDVDHADLGILLGDWGCTGGDCAGDCDGDGDTDQVDLGVVLALWGQECP